MTFSSYKLKNILASIKDLRGQIVFIFWFVFFLLLFFQVTIIENSINQVLNPSGTVVEVKTSQGVRINFKNYDEVVAKIKKAEDFEVSPRVTSNPFVRSQ